MDSNQRRRKPTDLQSAPFSHSGTPPQRICNYGDVALPCQHLPRIKRAVFVPAAAIFFDSCGKSLIFLVIETAKQCRKFSPATHEFAAAPAPRKQVQFTAGAARREARPLATPPQTVALRVWRRRCRINGPAQTLIRAWKRRDRPGICRCWRGLARHQRGPGPITPGRRRSGSSDSPSHTSREAFTRQVRRPLSPQSGGHQARRRLVVASC